MDWGEQLFELTIKFVHESFEEPRHEDPDYLEAFHWLFAFENFAEKNGIRATELDSFILTRFLEYHKPTNMEFYETILPYLTKFIRYACLEAEAQIYTISK